MHPPYNNQMPKDGTTNSAEFAMASREHNLGNGDYCRGHNLPAQPENLNAAIAGNNFESKQQQHNEKSSLLGSKFGSELPSSLAGDKLLANGTTMIQSLNVFSASANSIEECLKELRTDPTTGLPTNEAQRRIGFSGYNEFEMSVKESLLRKYIEQFKNPLIALLLVSAVLSVLLKQFDDALSITVAVVIVVSVGFVQEYRSEKTLENLNKLVPPTAHCIRNGRSVQFYARELVPGDIVVLSMGDRVPADLRLIEAIDLQIDESSFTGENEPRHKHCNTVKSPEGNGIEHLDNIAFMGTLVCSGRGKGVVVGTGANSKFGEVFQLMQAEESPKTPLQNSMDHLGTQLSFYSLGVIGGIFLIGLIQGRPVLDMFTIGVSLAVAAIPEGLPIVVAVTLAIGVVRMGNRNAVVKKLSAVETLGCVTVICSDKTGTLTKNEMTASTVLSVDGTRAEVTGVGYDPTNGECRLADTGARVSSHSHMAISRIIEIGCVCNNTQIINGTVLGQPTEGALMVLALKTQLDISRNYFRRIKEIPFTSETKWMAVQIEPVNRPGEIEVMVKGALDRILEMCIGYLQGGVHTMNLNEGLRQQILQTGSSMGGSGLRVIAMACGKDMNSLYYVGMVGIMDPPRPGCRESIETVQSAGVIVKMVTGDAIETACNIGLKLNLYRLGDTCLSGNQIDEMSDMDLERVIRPVSIIYRASPRHKLKIVKALQSIGEVVAMTGDGVNDAVALKKSDIGIAMGESGTDVCKEAADMVLINDDFSTIKAAIEEGKGIYHNITNFVKFQLSTYGFKNDKWAMLLQAAASYILGVYNNDKTKFSLCEFALQKCSSSLFDCTFNSISLRKSTKRYANTVDKYYNGCLGVEPVDADIIKQPPRNVKEPLLNRGLILNVVSSASVIIMGTLFVFYREMSADNKITPRDTTMTFTCFVLFDMWNALSCRSSRKMIWEIGILRNRMFCLAVSGSLLCQLLVIYFGPLQHIFQTEALTAYDLIFLTLLSSTVFIFNETKKYFELHRRGRYSANLESVGATLLDSVSSSKMLGTSTI